ncbi:helix-turn-helix domain-containing protein [Alcaligenes sp. RM2]|uniref:helix-turn-helix domain-containing protein n=1 Tax=Alcaligenes TaxID=507 RepID=UPI0009E86E9F|nr:MULTISPECIES: helix-turn-helix domain-containing protein [Alcaligenes]HRO20951.1 helix-turn-helix domain-containing protein [Alcaligenes phenolicus]HRP16245.1 helix-turn-helix domain-containing protein [Alcaligenes phenolicus]
MSARSLPRRLMEEGASFHSASQTVRQERAQAMLQSADQPLSVVAEQLGYSDTVTFSRAFKEWTRASPRRFSRRQS